MCIQSYKSFLIFQNGVPRVSKVPRVPKVIESLCVTLCFSVDLCVSSYYYLLFYLSTTALNHFVS